MLRNIKATIFDVDGTLLDSNQIWQIIDQQFMNERNLTLTDDFQKQLDGLTFHQVAEYCKDFYNLKESAKELMDIWINMAIDEYSYHVKSKPGAKRLLKYLNDNDIKIAICTSNSHDLIDPALKHNDLYDYIDIFHTASTIGDSKDDPDVYLRLASELDVDPENCLVFDDIYPIINTVSKIGMKSCVVLDQRSIEVYSKDLLIQAADYNINDFRDIDYAKNNN